MQYPSKPSFPAQATIGLTLLLAACESKAPAESNGSTVLTINIAESDWGKEVTYQTDAEGTRLIIDGVRFTIEDPVSAQVNFDALGVTGVKITGDYKVTHKSTDDANLVFMRVLGEPVTIQDGVLHLGTKELGAVVPGDEFLAGKQGLRRVTK